MYKHKIDWLQDELILVADFFYRTYQVWFSLLGIILLFIGGVLVQYYPYLYWKWTILGDSKPPIQLLLVAWGGAILFTIGAILMGLSLRIHRVIARTLAWAWIVERWEEKDYGLPSIRNMDVGGGDSLQED